MDSKDAKRRTCLEETVAANAGLVKSVALRLSFAYKEELDDLIQIGYIGLIKAAERFDPGRGLRFSTYAVPMITGEIRSQLRDRGRIKVSRSLKSDAAAIRRAENDFVLKTGRSPRISELAESCELSSERVIEALAAYDAMKNFEDYEESGLWTDEEERNITKIDIDSAVRVLPLREKQVILLRYYRDLTQSQVARIMGISQVQVSRIEKKTLKLMAQNLDT